MNDPLLNAPRPWAAHIWWIALAVGAAGFAFVWLATPHGREIESAWNSSPSSRFRLLCCAIAFFPWVSPRLYWLLYVPFVFLTGYLMPRISYFYFGDGARAQG